MNRNAESHFATLPSVNVQRSVFDRSSTHKTTFNVGDIIPIFLDEVLPGDTFQLSTSKVVRMQTLLTPIMDNIYLDTYYFFVPNRLVWDHWEEFCGENKTGPWVQQVERFIPTITSPPGGFASGTIADYMGIPVGLDFSAADDVTYNRLPSALPFRAYAICCDQYFRDENLSDPLNIPKGDAVTTGTNDYDPVSGPAAGGLPYRAAKYHDYFTSCLPAPQKGQAVSILKSLEMPVVPRRDGQDNSPSLLTTPVHLYRLDESAEVHSLPLWESYKNLASSDRFYSSATSGGSPTLNMGNSFLSSNATSSSTSFSHYPLSLANLVTVPGPDGAGLNINDLRLAFQLQRFYEKSARSGTRYIEILLGQFGVSSPDARLQRAEYLGGNRVPIQIHEVTNQAQGELDFLGDLGAMSQTSDVHDDFIKSFTEHGYVIGLAVARYDHSYCQGFDRHWFRHTFTDFYLPVFANIGEQPVYKYEIFASPLDFTAAKPEVFGYQEAWSEYRYNKPSRVSGEMRPGIPNTLASWHLADYYTLSPTLSDSWIREDKTNVDRTLAVTSQLSNQFFADFYFQCRVTRPMPMYSIPGLIDHN